MPLSRAIYYSEINGAIRPENIGETVNQIVIEARAMNEKYGITGSLIYSDGWFLQVLEGRRRPLSETLVRIFADTRHQNIRLMDFRVVSERRFSEWTMFSIGSDQFVESLISEQVESETDKEAVFDADHVAAIMQFISLNRECHAFLYID